MTDQNYWHSFPAWLYNAGKSSGNTAAQLTCPQPSYIEEPPYLRRAADFKQDSVEGDSTQMKHYFASRITLRSFTQKCFDCTLNVLRTSASVDVKVIGI